jgi:hypothetical protein
LAVGEEAWWFVTSPIGRNADGKHRRMFEGAARVRILTTEADDRYQVKILRASGVAAQTKLDLGIDPVVHRRDLFQTHGDEHQAFGAKIALATREDRP